MVSKADIGRAIDQLRQARGWTKKKLSQDAGIDQGNLNRIISGTQEATLDRLQSLAAVFGVRMSDIMRMAETGQTEDPRKTALIRLVEQMPTSELDGVFRRPSDASPKPADETQSPPRKRSSNQ
jgi:transcriptional regulator with XRE-family HTH domain